MRNIFFKNKAFFLILFSLSCSTLEIQQKSTMVNVGNSKDDVIKIMGFPENRQMRGAQEALQYCETTFGMYHFLIIWFENGKVSGITTTEDAGRPFNMCTSAFRTIRWEDAPTITIEHRER